MPSKKASTEHERFVALHIRQLKGSIDMSFQSKCIGRHYCQCQQPFWGQVKTRTDPLQCVLPHKTHGPLLVGCFPLEHLALASLAFSRQLSIWVLIISRHDLYLNDEVLGAHSAAGLRFWISAIFIMYSVGNSSKLLEQFRVWVGTGTKPLQQVLLYKNRDHYLWAGFHRKTRPLQAGHSPSK